MSSLSTINHHPGQVGKTGMTTLLRRLEFAACVVNLTRADRTDASRTFQNGRDQRMEMGRSTRFRVPHTYLGMAGSEIYATKAGGWNQLLLFYQYTKEFRFPPPLDSV